jgi:hypothetical protein
VIYSLDEITRNASRAGGAAHTKARARGADSVASRRAYNIAYWRAVPPCWANLVPPPRQPTETGYDVLLSATTAVA